MYKFLGCVAWWNKSSSSPLLISATEQLSFWNNWKTSQQIKPSVAHGVGGQYPLDGLFCTILHSQGSIHKKKKFAASLMECKVLWKSSRLHLRPSIYYTWCALVVIGHDILPYFSRIDRYPLDYLWLFKNFPYLRGYWIVENFAA